MSCNISKIQICMIKHFNQKFILLALSLSLYIYMIDGLRIPSPPFLIMNIRKVVLLLMLKIFLSHDVIALSNSFNCSSVMYALQN